MLNEVLKSVGPLIAAALAGKLERGEFRFDDGRFHFDSEIEGQTLADLDLTQPAPESVMVMGSTAVSITEGKTFRIHAEGDGADALRFTLRDGKLSILCKHGGEPAAVDITMPAPRALAVAGSGSIRTNAVAAIAKVSIAGSGSVTLDGISAERLKANIMGSGALRASGSVERLKLNVAGSGMAEMPELEAARAKISVAGSGRASFTSDGEVGAHMMGSGHITVYGRANCRVHSMGSGQLRCVPRDRRDDEPDAPASPKPPTPPKPPKSGGAAAKPRKPRKPAKAKSAKSAKASKAKKANKATKKPVRKRKSSARKSS